MFTVDTDIHANDTPAELAPYCDEPWRVSLETLASVPSRYLDVPGFAPAMRLDPPIPGQHDYRSVHTPAQMQQELTKLGIDIGILFPDHLLLFALLPHLEYATAVSHAYNRWLTEGWLGEEGLYGAVLACPQNPEDSAAAIRHYGRHEKMVAVYLPTAGVNPLWGHQKYDPIFEAAQEMDLTVALHSVTIISPSFPCQMDQFENHFARQVLGHAFAMMANLTSLIHTGVPVRFPKLRVVFTEAGIGWVPYMMWRMDKYHREYRRTVPILERPPSEYIRERMWFATQPIEEPEEPREMVQTIEHVGIDRVVFASDWPHHDFDHPKGLLNLPMAAEIKRKVMGENALAAFPRIPAPVALAAD